MIKMIESFGQVCRNYVDPTFNVKTWSNKLLKDINWQWLSEPSLAEILFRTFVNKKSELIQKLRQYIFEIVVVVIQLLLNFLKQNTS